MPGFIAPPRRRFRKPEYYPIHNDDDLFEWLVRRTASPHEGLAIDTAPVPGALSDVGISASVDTSGNAKQPNEPELLVKVKRE